MKLNTWSRMSSATSQRPRPYFWLHAWKWEPDNTDSSMKGVCPHCLCSTSTTTLFAAEYWLLKPSTKSWAIVWSGSGIQHSGVGTNCIHFGNRQPFDPQTLIAEAGSVQGSVASHLLASETCMLVHLSLLWTGLQGFYSQVITPAGPVGAWERVFERKYPQYFHCAGPWNRWSPQQYLLLQPINIS